MPIYCDCCGSEINRNPSQVARYALKRNFCSRPCFRMYQSKQEVQRFKENIRKEGDCWIWTGAINHDGYGIFYSGVSSEMAHRASWRIFKGTIPDGFNICHNCPGGDNRACVNPNHLFQGTQRDNVLDAVKKGTHPKGEKVHCSKLTSTMVSEVRSRHANGERVTELAKEYGVAGPTISNIVLRKTWRHVF